RFNSSMRLTAPAPVRLVAAPAAVWPISVAHSGEIHPSAQRDVPKVLRSRPPEQQNAICQTASGRIHLSMCAPMGMFWWAPFERHPEWLNAFDTFLGLDIGWQDSGSGTAGWRHFARVFLQNWLIEPRPIDVCHFPGQF
ncbi:MAG: hypothetical protein MUF06_21295, partial [Pirellulaceae bacterium]|nr:hypothetical protein [Pirellulaceae bacterium]